MIQTKMGVVALAVVLLAAAAVRADQTTAAVKIAKPATVLVLLPEEKGSGSGFCVDKKGLFVTNAHVVAGLKRGAKVELVLNAAETNEKVLSASVIAIDRENDLALLQAERPPADLTPLVLGNDADLAETQQVIALGFPFGTMLALKDSAPSVSINVARITSLRKSKSGLEIIQIDSQLNPGNSGGPLVDLKGRVVGVNTAGILASGINFAVPVGRVKALLVVPQVTIELPKVTSANKADQHTFTVTVTPGSQDLSKLKAQLVIGTRTVDMTGPRTGEAKFTVKAAPVPAQSGPLKLPCSVDVGGDGPFNAILEDTSIRTAGKTVKLSEIANIRREGDHVIIEMKDGSELAKQPPLSGRVTGVEDSEAAKKVTVDLAKIQNLVVSDPPPTDRIRVTANILLEGKVVRSVTAELVIEGEPGMASRPEPKRPREPARPPKGGDEPPAARAGSVAPPAAAGKAGLPTSRPTFDETQIVVRTDEPFSKWAVGGSGRYFALYQPKARSVALLDIVSGSILHTIPNISEDVLMTAGRDKLLLVLPGDRMIQRWNLNTLKREKIAPLPGSGITKIALMGSNSAGPLLLASDETLLVEIENFKPIRYSGPILKTQQPFGYVVDVSADGTLFCGIPDGMGPVPYHAMQIKGSRTTVTDFDSTSHAYRYGRPSADGGLIFLAQGGIYNRNLQQVDAKWLAPFTCFPTVDPRYFIAVKFIEGERKRGRTADAKTEIAICTSADRKIVHTFTGLPEMAPEGDRNEAEEIRQNVRRGHERFHYVPWAGLIVALDWKGEKVILRKLDLKTAIAEAGGQGGGQLLVDSVPPDTFTPGQTLTYTIAVTSKSGSPKFNLESGPAGLTVSPKGVVRWVVPRNFAEESVQVIISITDEGEEVLHTMNLARAEK